MKWFSGISDFAFILRCLLRIGKHALVGTIKNIINPHDNTCWARVLTMVAIELNTTTLLHEYYFYIIEIQTYLKVVCM